MKYLGTPTISQSHLERDARISCPTEINQLKAHGWEGTCCQVCDDKLEFVITSSYWQVLSIYNAYLIYTIYSIMLLSNAACCKLQDAWDTFCCCSFNLMYIVNPQHHSTDPPMQLWCNLKPP